MGKLDIFKKFSGKKIGFEFGIEQEMLLIAIRKKSKKLYNLNVAYLIVANFNFFTSRDDKLKELFSSGWSISEEYSKCLLEIISPPYEKDLVDLLLEEIKYINKKLNKYLSEFLIEFYPKIHKSFYCKLVMNGTSETNLYIDEKLQEFDDVAFPECNVLSRNVDFVLKNKNVLVNMNGYVEPAIGIYNHLSSLHITFHPTYGNNKNNNIKKYLNFLSRLQQVIEIFKFLDNGNKRIIRDRKTIILKENLRDLFLKVLAEKIHKQPQTIKLTGISYIQKRASLSNIISILEKNSHQKIDTIDQVFKSWNCAHFRPRIIDNKLPGFEIRSFGSNFSQKNIRLLLNYIISLDATI